MPQTELKEAEQLAYEIAARLKALPRLNTENVRAVRREVSKQLASAPPHTVIALALRLLNQSDWHRSVAYELVHHHRAALRSLRARDLQRLGRGLDGWASVDTFACYLAGPAWREKQASDTLIHRWARSKDRWWRRAALVSTVPLNNKARGGGGDTRRTIEVCRMLAGDHDDMVVKALSWALRELSKHDPQAVQGFLTEQQAVLAARVVREVRNKLLTGLKNPRR